MQPSRGSRRISSSVLAAWWYRAEPPGGWPAATLALLVALLVVALLLPSSAIGQPVRELVGAGIPVVAAWPAWGLWLIARGRPFPWARSISLLVLTSAIFVGLALREPRLGGALGLALLDQVDGAFGRVGGLTLLAMATAAAATAILGPWRVLGALMGLATITRALVGSRNDARIPPRRGRLHSRPPFNARGTSTDEIVILGPRGVERSTHPSGRRISGSSGIASLDVRHKAEATRRTTEPIAERPAAPRDWQRPAPSMLGLATDSGAFSPADLKARARVIEETLANFNVEARVIEIQQGPAITQFGLDPAPGVAVNKIVSRQHDLALRLGAPSLRVLAPVPGRPLVGLEVPNASVATVKLGDLLPSHQFARARLPMGIGMDVSGKPVVGDLARMPHLLVAGATGSGKSVCINTLIASLLVARTPEEVQLVLIDPKQVEMSQYKGLPHLRLPVVTDMAKVVATLRWTVLEMERRYTRFSEVSARNIVAFNERFTDERLPYLVVIVDELADMMMTAAEEVERQICRLAQLGRAAGVHLVVATQRPSVDVLTGLIKANLPTRIAFAVSSQTDSRVILDRVGAERLLGRGDGLYQPGDEMNPRRVQGAFVSDEEIEALCSHWRSQGISQHTLEDEEQLERLARQDDPEEKLMAQARQIFAERDGDVSVAHLARRLKLGTVKAARIHQALVADEAAARSLPPPEEGG